MKTKTDKMEIGQLFRRRSKINLDPLFQRESVWKLSKQQYLIDSIIRNWGIPKIYLEVSKDNKGEEQYVCIDGKQRLNAIFSFLTNNFALSEKHSPSHQNKKYQDLPVSIQDKFDKFLLTIERVTDATDEELGELFTRLQGGVSLNSAEKLKANASMLSNFIDTLIKSFFFTKKISLKNTRYAHFAVAAQLCLLDISGNIVNAKFANLEKFFKDYASFNKNGLEAERIKQIVAYLTKMFNDDSYELSNRANIVSVYLLISELMKRGDINGKEKSLGKFFSSFIKNLKIEISKDPNDADPLFLSYQNATIQAADSVTSIKIRHKILIEKLVNYKVEFKTLLNATTEEEVFKKTYDKYEKLYGNKPSKFNNWLISNYPKVPKLMCKREDGSPYTETLPVHVRNAMHHSDHPSYNKSQIKRAIKFLETLK